MTQPPTDQQLAKLRLLYERAERERREAHQAYVRELQQVHDKYRPFEAASATAFNEYEKRAKQLGWCVTCGTDLQHCAGHAAYGWTAWSSGARLNIPGGAYRTVYLHDGDDRQPAEGESIVEFEGHRFLLQQPNAKR